MNKKTDFSITTFGSNLDTFVGVCKGLGVSYKPSNPALAIPALDALLLSAEASLLSVSQATAANRLVVDKRDDAFRGSGPLFTRVNNALIACAPAQSMLDDADSFIKKLRGKRITAMPEATPDPDKPGEFLEPNTKSYAQKSYNDQVVHMTGFLNLLKLLPGYKPNEPDLTTTGLQDYINELKDLNRDAAQSNHLLNEAIQLRDKVLFHQKTGAVQRTTEVKAYVKSLFGARSSEYLELSKIRFRQVKKA